MATYTVSWIIEVDAATPEEAALEARKAQEPGTLALHFLVVDEVTHEETKVELPVGS